MGWGGGCAEVVQELVQEVVTNAWRRSKVTKSKVYISNTNQLVGNLLTVNNE